MIVIPLRTRNPNNGAMGHTRLASILRSRDRKREREAAHLAVLAAGKVPELPVVVVVRRVAPSQGLDPHDGLGAALKGVIDGTADALGLKSDRDARVTWRLEQRRGKRGEYAVEIEITPAPRPCTWGAGGCLRDAKHMVTIKLHSDKPEEERPMCDRCAAIFDPALGARSGYTLDFRARRPIEEARP